MASTKFLEIDYSSFPLARPHIIFLRSHPYTMHGFHTSRHLGLLKQAISPGTTSRPVLGWTGEPAPIRHIFKNHATRFFDR
jgi:hypothetical protein